MEEEKKEDKAEEQKDYIVYDLQPHNIMIKCNYRIETQQEEK